MNTQSYFNYFGPEFAGEMNIISTFLTSCNLMRANLHYPKAVPAMLEAIRIGHEMGDNLKRPLFYVKWEDYFHNTIAEIREDLNIVVAPSRSGTLSPMTFETSATAFMTPIAKSPGVVDALLVWMLPSVPSTTTSVKVPPVSIPIVQRTDWAIVPPGARARCRTRRRGINRRWTQIDADELR